jgi:hypothetical protein
MHQKLKYDLAYVKNRSLLLDLLLVFVTIVAIITPRHGVALCEKMLKKYSEYSFFTDYKKTKNDMF